MPLDNKCRIGPLAGAPPTRVRWSSSLSESSTSRTEVGKNPVDTAYDVGSVLADVGSSKPTSSRLLWFLMMSGRNIQCHQEKTIRRRLTEVGLRSRRPLRRLPLTPHHRQCRLDFCRPRATWSVTDWRRVIFSDESRFSLSADDQRTRVWSFTGQRSNPAFIVERHTAISQGYDVLPWPARSPDLSPIEHVQGAGKAIAAVPRYRRINCADAKTMAGSSTGGHK
ncbi:HTH_Tnp_Tc3_2 domain-containing protein [Trichonephila clavipes]|nr:HTH_Tnp_Tc3_2 domain-containing protein [Trichonephila clavipes]